MAKVFIVSGERQDARVFLRIGRLAGTARVLAGRCVIVFPPRLRPLCFRFSSSISRFVILSLSTSQALFKSLLSAYRVLRISMRTLFPKLRNARAHGSFGT